MHLPDGPDPVAAANAEYPELHGIAESFHPVSAVRSAGRVRKPNASPHPHRSPTANAQCYLSPRKDISWKRGPLNSREHALKLLFHPATSVVDSAGRPQP